ncbi:hypothetical protein RV18_GL001353 [Enterococcus termitis]|nr:hypothetical protein RV18_GL001353 [Enterococcus termitis]
MPENLEAFTWWTDREKPFGEYSYKLSSEAEIEEKFDLKTLPSREKTIALFKDNFSIEGVTLEPEVTDVQSDGKNLTLKDTILYKNAEELYPSYIEIITMYQYLPELKKAKLYSQTISITNMSVDGQYHGKNFDGLIKELGALLDQKDMDKRIKEFKEKTADKEAIKLSDVSIFSTTESKGEKSLFSANFGVKYGSTGVPMKIYLETTDFRE